MLCYYYSIDEPISIFLGATFEFEESRKLPSTWQINNVLDPIELTVTVGPIPTLDKNYVFILYLLYFFSIIII